MDSIQAHVDHLPVADDALNVVLSIRLSAADKARLDRLAGDLPAHLVARAALRLGLAQMESDPQVLLRALLGSASPESAAKPKRGKR